MAELYWATTTSTITASTTNYFMPDGLIIAASSSAAPAFNDPAWRGWLHINHGRARAAEITMNDPAPPAVIERVREANARAEALRDKYLSPQQRRQLAAHGYFDVPAPSGLVYRIHPGTHGNIAEMVRQPDGRLVRVADLCCQPEGVPTADAHLAQLLWLTHDEERFRRVANRTAR